MAKEPIFLIESNDDKSHIKKGDYALIVTEDNDIEFLMPMANEVTPTKPVPKLAIALIAIANKLSDKPWVDRVISDFFLDQDKATKNNK